jgi:hypothetical protein
MIIGKATCYDIMSVVYTLTIINLSILVLVLCLILYSHSRTRKENGVIVSLIKKIVG